MIDDEALLEATASLVFEGHTVGEPGALTCSCCRTRFRTGEGARVRFYATRRPGDRWQITELRCLDCHDRGAQLEAPTLGLGEVVADARLARRMGVAELPERLVLVDVAPKATSPPSEAAEQAP